MIHNICLTTYVVFGKKTTQKAKPNKKQVNCFMIKYLLLSSYPLYQAFEAT